MSSIKYFFFYFILIVPFLLLSQEKRKAVESRYFVTVNDFESHYKAEDSIGFFIRKNNDTLIEVKKHRKPKGISVPYVYKDSTFLELYKKVAFQKKNKDSARTHPMKYWKSPIRIFFSENISNKTEKEVMLFAKLIEKEIDSLTISKVNKLEDSNFVIYNDIGYQYDPNLTKYKSSTPYTYWNKKNQITKVSMKIIKSQMFSNKLETQKIKELFFQSLGWFVLSDELSCENYFSNCYSDNKQISKLDLELLKYHYSYGICKGTSKEAFENLHKKIKSDLKTPGVSTPMIFHKY